eukprot:5895221-Amphidinium_carterae.1
MPVGLAFIPCQHGAGGGHKAIGDTEGRAAACGVAPGKRCGVLAKLDSMHSHATERFPGSHGYNVCSLSLGHCGGGDSETLSHLTLLL